MQKLVYQNQNYDLGKINNHNKLELPTLLHTAYYDEMVIMPKCQAFVTLTNIDTASMMRILHTTKYLAFIRQEYKNEMVKKGCICQILDMIPNIADKRLRLQVSGISRFMSYQDAAIEGYPHEMVKPDISRYYADNSLTPIPMDIDKLDPVLVRCFIYFLNSLNLDKNIDFTELSKDKLLNSMIMTLPMSDIERRHLSELPSLAQREDQLALILKTTFDSLTGDTLCH